jgi:RimJ/RimL family protein N-acetyltransferase
MHPPEGINIGVLPLHGRKPGKRTVPLIQNTLNGSFFIVGHLDAGVRIQAVGSPQRDHLIAMYDQFDPLGAALGLPPRTAEARREWVGRTLSHKVNVAAFLPAGEIVGHCFLAGEKTGSAEIAIFVHQEFRMRGVGTALVKAVLEWGCAMGLRRVWSMTSADNSAALRLQKNCGFRVTSVSLVVDLEIDLSAARAARQMSRLAYVP